MSALRAVTVRDALDGAITAIGAGGSPSARLDAEVLLAHALGTTRERLYSEPAAAVEGAAVRAFQSHVRRRAVDRELALALPAGARVLDCCCGSGAIALALKDERPDLQVSGSDVDPAALAVAAANGASLQLDVAWQLADLLDGLPDAYDAIVANPPYVESAAIAALEPEISRHEPRRALDGGASGLDTITRLIDQAAATSACILILEHGHAQEETMATHCKAAGYDHVEHHPDLSRSNRALSARRSRP